MNPDESVNEDIHDDETADFVMSLLKKAELAIDTACDLAAGNDPIELSKVLLWIECSKAYTLVSDQAFRVEYNREETVTHPDDNGSVGDSPEDIAEAMESVAGVSEVMIGVAPKPSLGNNPPPDDPIEREKWFKDCTKRWLISCGWVSHTGADDVTIWRRMVGSTGQRTDWLSEQEAAVFQHNYESLNGYRHNRLEGDGWHKWPETPVETGKHYQIVVVAYGVPLTARYDGFSDWIGIKDHQIPRNIVTHWRELPALPKAE